jgi:hypothetical protein
MLASFDGLGLANETMFAGYALYIESRDIVLSVVL